ncbi:MAG: hypothetical protein M0026_20890 [Nocardiopsaceae bacterium]|nr:hypothetical protein [Nocardiopsaceae bacterium]
MSSDTPIQYGNVKASYFWDDGSGINGDTGAPASGEPMQKGLAASPSWPLGTEGYVEYNGKKAEFFIGDRGPGHPAENCDVLLDLDGKTFAELTGESWNDTSYTVTGGQGHIDVEYYITEWGDGAGTPGAPEPMSGSEVCNDAVSPLPEDKGEDGSEDDEDVQKAGKDEKEESHGQGEDGSEDGEDAAAASGQQNGSGGEFQAETAANDMSGISLMGSDLSLTAGVLTLAILPALLVAVFFARRRSAVAYASSSQEGRHRAPSLATPEGRERLVNDLRERTSVLMEDLRERTSVLRTAEGRERALQDLRDRFGQRNH